MKTIGYMISGYPSLKQCVEISKAYIAGGCDMLEISIPLEENLEAPYLCDLMRTTVQKYPDYEQHLNVIREITRMYPYITYTLLIYKEVMDGIGVSRLGEFCRECGILYINSPDITDQESIGILKSYGVRLAGLILYDWDKEMMETAKKQMDLYMCRRFLGTPPISVKAAKHRKSLSLSYAGKGSPTSFIAGEGFGLRKMCCD